MSVRAANFVFTLQWTVSMSGATGTQAAKWRQEQDAILRNIHIHQDTDQNYIERWPFRTPARPIIQLGKVHRVPSQATMANWLPLVDALRTLLLAPTPAVRETIVDLRLGGRPGFLFPG
jgi:hypothetical protein